MAEPKPTPIPADLMAPPFDEAEVERLIGHLHELVGAGATASVIADALTGLHDRFVSDSPDDPLGRFTVDSVRKAEWCARKLAPLVAQRDEAKALAAEWRAQVDAWEKDQVAQTVASIVFFEHLLTGWALAQRTITGKATSKLPSAVVKTTNVPAAVKIADEELVAAWAKTVFDPDQFEHDPDAAAEAARVLAEIVKTTEKVLVSNLRSHVALEQVPTGRSVLVLSCGCEIVMAEDVGDEASTDCPSGHGPVSIVKRTPEALLVPSYGHVPVPGCAVEPEHVTVKIVPVTP